ncbi:MAG: outer membrane protein assembly factor BamA [Desulfobulbaceae bacterium]|uniref:Outer membrane protein assembly factor BamA n=1 Tax=Candidatus Desulfatifera sulfidica TaxID=2841691 RepID=A0A8J6N841_9BACT|nr:outer membrane protein assembly factor BamA [Candidatus Desulfatifera sulfidica]
MLPRKAAGQLLDYAGTWPPPAQALNELSQRTNKDYVAIGSLTLLGEQISLDYKIYDLLDPGAPKYLYEARPTLNDLDAALDAIIQKAVNHTGREFFIATVTISGNERIDPGAILRKVTSQTGDLYSQMTLRHDLKAIFDMGYFDDVRIRVEQGEQGKEITFEVDEKPVLAKIEFTGIDEEYEEDAQAAANLKANTILNQSQINQAAAAIQNFLKSKGYYETTVVPEISFPLPGQATLRFVINQGDKLYIKQISFVGNNTFKAGVLEDQIDTDKKGWFSWISGRGLLNMDELRQDAARINIFYNNQGFLEAKVADPQVHQQDKALSVTFTIEEGPRYRMGQVDFSGDLISDKEILRELLTFPEEEYVNKKSIREDLLKITDHYAEEGYAFADVKPRMIKGATLDTLDITLEIDKGELVHIDRIVISGNSRTRDNVIRREMRIEEGGVFDSKALRTSSQKIQRLDFFEDVSVTPQPTAEPDQMDVLVEVKEKNTGQFSIGMGYSSVDNLVVMGEISENNFLGRGDRMSFKADISGTNTRYNLSYTNPRFRDSQLSWGVDLFNWVTEYDDYDKDSKGGAIRIGYPLWEKWRGYGSYSFTNSKLSEISDTASWIILQSLDLEITSALSFTVRRDTRDRLTAATKGSRNQISIKYAGGPLGGDSQFTKVEASSGWYFPLPWSTVFHIKGAAGQIWENKSNKLPVYERFFLGGMNTIRGFEYGDASPIDAASNEQIGGVKMWYANIEYIFPLLKEAGLQGVVFYDIGRAMDNDEDWTVENIDHSTGFEFRWLSPMGPLRLIWGYNLDPAPHESETLWDFSIGGMF